MQLGGEQPHVKVRRGLVRDRFEPPKSKHGRREVSISAVLVDALFAHQLATGGDADALVFARSNGLPLNQATYGDGCCNLRPSKRACGPDSASTPFGTCASLLFAEGRNVKQVQRWLGHHSAAFTLARHVHLLPDEIAAPLDIDAAQVALAEEAELVAA